MHVYIETRMKSCVCMYARMYVYVCFCSWICAYIHIHIHTYTYTYIYIYIHIYIYTDIHIYIRRFLFCSVVVIMAPNIPGKLGHKSNVARDAMSITITIAVATCIA